MVIFVVGKLLWEAFEVDENNIERIISKGEYVFYIRGENPSFEDIVEYVGDDRWYFKTLTRHECAGKGQFNPIKSQYTNYGSTQQGSVDDYDDFEGCPNYGPPDGWGVMQLEQDARNYYINITGSRRNRDQQLLWNWQDNVDAGIVWAEKLRTDEDVDESKKSAIRWMKRQIAHAMYYHNNREDIGNMPTIKYPENSQNAVELDKP